MSNRNNNRNNRKRRTEKARKRKTNFVPRVEKMTQWDEVLLRQAASVFIKTPFGEEATDAQVNISFTERINGKNYLLIYSEDFQLRKGETIWSSMSNYGGEELFEMALFIPDPETNRGGFYIIGTHDGDNSEIANKQWCSDVVKALINPTLGAHADYFYQAVKNFSMRLEFYKIVSDFEKTYQ